MIGSTFVWSARNSHPSEHMMRFFLIALLFLCAIPAHAQQVLQTVTVSQNGAPLPPSTGQAVDLATCQQVIATNLAAAPTYGYAVNGGSFTDPTSGVTITQGCDISGSYVAEPVHPLSGIAPSVPQISAPPIGVCTDIWLIIGQSNAANNGLGRYTSSPAAGYASWAYSGGGTFYQLSDPLPLTTGTDAGPWARLADQMMGKLPLNPACTAGINRVVVINGAVGGTVIAEWAPGGDENAHLLSTISDALAHGLTPTRIFWVQGEGDTGLDPNTMTPVESTAAYMASFNAMLTSIRNAGVSAPIYVSTTTICNLRDAANPDPPSVVNRPANWYVNTELARQNIRAAQASLVNGTSVRAGPDTDTIPWQWRAEGDGCHLGPAGLDEHARRWAAALAAQ